MATKIRYIGKKDKEACHFYPSAVFNGHGDVQSVPDNIAAEMLKHSHFELVGKPPKEEKPESVTRENDIDDIEESNKPPMVNLETMDDGQLREYAQRYFDHQFHHKTGAVKMRETIVGLMNRG